MIVKCVNNSFVLGRVVKKNILEKAKFLIMKEGEIYMRKKQKFLVVYVVLLIIINSVVCYADTTVKGGYYRLRNYASGMYLNWNNNSNLVQKSFP